MKQTMPLKKLATNADTVNDRALTEEELRDVVLKADAEVDEGHFVSLEQAQELMRKVWGPR